MALRLTVFGLVSILMIGCTTKPTLYEWGGYESKLHKAYKDPSAIPEFQAELLELIQSSESKGMPPPPGVYAEYGYALYLSGQLSGSIVYFAKERESWPESAVLMTTVIQRIQFRIEEQSALNEEMNELETVSAQSDASEARGSGQ